MFLSNNSVKFGVLKANLFSILFFLKKIIKDFMRE